MPGSVPSAEVGGEAEPRRGQRERGGRQGHIERRRTVTSGEPREREARRERGEGPPPWRSFVGEQRKRAAHDDLRPQSARAPSPRTRGRVRRRRCRSGTTRALSARGWPLRARGARLRRSRSQAFHTSPRCPYGAPENAALNARRGHRRSRRVRRRSCQSTRLPAPAPRVAARRQREPRRATRVPRDHAVCRSHPARTRASSMGVEASDRKRASAPGSAPANRVVKKRGACSAPPLNSASSTASSAR